MVESGSWWVAAVVLGLVAAAGARVAPSKGPQCYTAAVTHFDPLPVVAKATNTSTFAQVFNPSWIQASPGTGGKAGLLIRTQDCEVPTGKCVACSGTGAKSSKLTFAELLNDDNVTTAAPRFRAVNNNSVVFGPHNSSDSRGTEDPRVAFDASTGTYYMLYTCYGDNSTVELCLATSTNPTTADASAWTRHGSLGFGQGSKSAALHIRGGGPSTHAMYWGAGEIRYTTSNSLFQWQRGTEFITETAFGNPNVEAGPPPMRLSTGDFVFFHNSWNGDFPKPPGYQPAWVVVSGSDPSKIIAWAQEPLWSPQREKWMTGDAPWFCNVPNVAFLEAAHPTNNVDEFRVYFGGSDTVIGSAVVQVKRTNDPCKPS